MIPVRDKYVNKAIEDGILQVECDGKFYRLDKERLQNPRITKPVRDYFSNQMQKLMYFGVPAEITRKEAVQHSLFN